jgi:hypothetical protein
MFPSLPSLFNKHLFFGRGQHLSGQQTTDGTTASKANAITAES